MRILKTLCCFFLVFFFASCSSSKRATFRIGIDSSWSPLNLEAFQPYVNGYTEDLLLEIARYAGVEWVKVETNWDTLLEGLQEKTYDAVLTSMPAYSFNQVKYDFSQNFLDLGPVLIVPVNAKSNDLTKLSNEVVGIMKEDPAFLLLQNYPEIIVRKYETIPDLLNGVVTGSLEGALLDRLVANSYIRDLYAEQLKISTEPLTNAGLHMVSLKGQKKHLIDLFNHAFSQLEKQKKIRDLQKKWQLYVEPT